MQPFHDNIGGAGHTALYYIHQFSQEKTLDIASQVLNDAASLNSIHYFSAWGPLVKTTSQYQPCAHYLTPLDRRFKRAVILKNAIPLPPSRSLSIVLGTMLRDMGEGSEIYIQSNRTKKATASWVMPEDIFRDLPSLEVSELEDNAGWIKLSWVAAIENELANLRSIYPVVSQHLPEYFETLASAGLPCTDTLTNHHDSAENAFCYPMHWTLHSMAILETHLPPPHANITGIDVGGSYGFLACELASRGYSAINLEMLDWRVNKVFPWLVDLCEVAERTKGVVSHMEQLTVSDQRFNFILFMGSLLCIDRRDVSSVLDTAKRLLKPGGIIVIRENLLIDSTHFSPSEETRFTPSELNSFLHNHLGTPQYFCHLGLARTITEVMNLWTVFAVVQKPTASRYQSFHIKKWWALICRWFSK